MNSAIAKLLDETKNASGDVLDLLNVIVDSYCFKNKNVDHMNFLKLKLQRKFDAAAARHRRMVKLLEDVWWEQLFGFHLFSSSTAPSPKTTCVSLARSLQTCGRSTMPCNSSSTTSCTSCT